MRVGDKYGIITQAVIEYAVNPMAGLRSVSDWTFPNLNPESYTPSLSIERRGSFAARSWKTLRIRYLLQENGETTSGEAESTVGVR
jgi:hypothetical protein